MDLLNNTPVGGSGVMLQVFIPPPELVMAIVDIVKFLVRTTVGVPKEREGGLTPVSGETVSSKLPVTGVPAPVEAIIW